MNVFDRFQTQPLPLFDVVDEPKPPPRKFDGKTFVLSRDGERLTSQLHRVFDLMLDGKWRTHAEIVAAVGGSVTGVSARLRDFRKPKFGSHTVDSRIRGNAKDGLWEFRLIPREQQ